MADNNYQQQNNVDVQAAVNSALETEKKNKKKKKWIIIAVVAVVIIIICAIAGAGGNDDSAVKVDESTSASTPADVSTTAEEEKSTVFNKGDVVEVGNVKITFTDCNADWTDYNQYMEPQSGNKVVRAEFTFENTGSADEVLNSLDCYADNVSCEEYFYADDYKSPTLESLSSGRVLNAVVYFEVPENAEEIVLEYAASYWTSDHITFVIK